MEALHTTNTSAAYSQARKEGMWATFWGTSEMSLQLHVIWQLTPTNGCQSCSSLVSHGQTQMEEVWDTIIEHFVAHIVECVPTTVQYSVTCYRKDWAEFNWWCKTFLALIFQVYSPIVPSNSTPSRNLNMSATRSLTHAITNVMTDYLYSIEFASHSIAMLASVQNRVWFSCLATGSWSWAFPTACPQLPGGKRNWSSLID